MKKETFKSILIAVAGMSLAFFVVTEVAYKYNEPTIVSMVTYPWER